LGPSGLGDNELLAIVIGGGAPGVSALGLANAVLESAGGLHGLLRLMPDDLCRIAGVGAARAAQVLSALELGRRSLARRPPERRQMASPATWQHFCFRSSARVPSSSSAWSCSTRDTACCTVGAVGRRLDSTAVQARDVFRHAAQDGFRGGGVFTTIRPATRGRARRHPPHVAARRRG
jgi:DNA repair protein RadC